MRIDFNRTLKALNGEDIKGSDGQAFQLKDAAIVALDSNYPDEPKLDAKEKYRRGFLAKRIYGAKEALTLDLGEVTLVRDLIGKAYGPRVVNEAWDMLDPKDAPAEPKQPTETIPQGR